MVLFILMRLYLFQCSDYYLSIETMVLRLIVCLKVVIVRTRNQDILNQCDIVVDVGGEYDETKYGELEV